MSPKKRLIEDNKLLDRSARLLQGDLRRLLRDYKRELAVFLRNPENYSDTAREGLSIRARLFANLQEALRNAGAADVIGRQMRTFPQLTKSALRVYEEFDTGEVLNWVGAEAEQIRAAVGIYRQELTRELDRALVAPMQRAVIEQSFGQRGARGAAIEAVLDQSDSLSVRQAERLVDDQFVRFSRSIKAESAKRLGLELFIYFGPDDSRTSDQCKALLRRRDLGVAGLWKSSEIKPGMVPRADFDPRYVGGHPNCRHAWLPITEEEARAEGYNGR